MTRKEILSRALEYQIAAREEIDYLLEQDGHKTGAFIPDNDLGHTALIVTDAEIAIKRLIQNDAG